VAAVDAAHQIIVVAHAHGTGSEQELLVPIVEALQPMLCGTTIMGLHPLHNKTATPTTPTVFTAADFTYDADARTCVCPAGKSLYRRGGNRKTNKHVGAHFRGARRDGGPCPPRTQCLRTSDTTPVRNIAFVHGRVDTDGPTHTARMQARIDAPA